MALYRQDQDRDSLDLGTALREALTFALFAASLSTPLFLAQILIGQPVG